MATRRGEMTGGTGRDQGVRLPGLRRARKEAGLSVRDLAEKSGVARSTISYLEQGDRSAQGRTARALADALEVELHYLVREPFQAAAAVGMVMSSPPHDEPGSEEADDGGEVLTLARERARQTGSSLNEALRAMIREQAAIFGRSPRRTGVLPSGAPRERRKVMSRQDAAASAVASVRGE